VIVVDTSVLVTSLIDGGPRGSAFARRLSGEQLTAPALIDLEAVNVLRGLVSGGKVAPAVASRAVAALPNLPIDRYPHEGLVPRIWELRDNLTAYDAAYVALAELLSATLVTADAKLRGAPGLGCVVELMG
jgi:predicted nucleic acid-binding protein